MVTANSLFEDLWQKFRTEGLDNPRGEARMITEEVLGLAPGTFLTEDPVDPALVQKAEDWAQKRLEGYPLQYLMGHWPFMDLEFAVGPGVLIPRQDTEEVCFAAINRLQGAAAPVVYDLCAGSGCIAVTMAHAFPDADVYAVEKEEGAWGYLTQNTAALAPRVHCLRDDVLNPAQIHEMPPADLIISNPPYLTKEDMDALQQEVTFEPATALAAGADGLVFYRLMPAVWKDKLKDGGMMIFEIGKGQHQDVAHFMQQAGFTRIFMEKDLTGIIRAVGGYIENK